MGPLIGQLAKLLLGSKGSGMKAAGSFLKKANRDISLMSSAVKMLAGNWFEVNDAAFKTARTMALGREQALAYNKQLLTATRELSAQFGVSAKELADFQKSYAEAIGRNVMLSKEQLAHMSVLSKITDSATAAQLVDEFDKMGLSIKSSLVNVGHFQEKAKAFGVNASKATKNLASNIKLASSYSFKNGLADIEKMTLESTGLRANMESIMRASEQFTSIDNAIETSAKLQVLGGSIGAFGANPMANMYNAMADPAQFQKDLTNVAKSLVTYNEDTGEVTSNPIQIEMAKAMASAMHLSTGEVTDMGRAKVLNEAVKRQVGDRGFTPEQMEAIQNLARGNFNKETKRFEITWLDENGEHTKDVSEINADELKVAQASQATEENMLVDVKHIRAVLERVYGRAEGTKSAQEDLEGAKTWWQSALAGISDYILKPSSNALNWVTTKLLGKQYFSDGGIVKPVAHAANGAIVPGDSYEGDKVPVMANSGEMILNTHQQNGLLDFIKTTAINRSLLQYQYSKAGGHKGIIESIQKTGKKIIEPLSDHVFNFKNFVIKSDIGNKLSSLIAEKIDLNNFKLTDLFKKLGASFWNTFKEFLKANLPTLAKALKGLSNVLEKANEKLIKPLIEGVKKVAGSTARFATTVASTINNKVLKPAKEFVRNNTAKVIDKAKSLIDKVKNSKLAKGISKKVKDTKENFAKAKKYASEKAGKAKAIVNQVKDTVKEKAKNAKKAIAEKTEKAKNAKKAIAEKTEKAKNVAKQAKEAVSEKAGNIKKTAAKKVAKAKAAVKSAGETVTKTAKGAWDWAKNSWVGKTAKGVAKRTGSIITGGIEAYEFYNEYKAIDANAKKREEKIKSSSMSAQQRAKLLDELENEKAVAVWTSAFKHFGSAAGSIIGGIVGGSVGSFAGGPLAPLTGLIGTLAGAYYGSEYASIMAEKASEAVLRKFINGTQNEDKFNEAKAKHASNGAIIPGNSYTGDKVPVMANSGEMILTRNQQAKLFNAINALSVPQSSISTNVKALPDIGNFIKVRPLTKANDANTNINRISGTNINLNLSGTIKLEGGGKSVDLDLGKLIDTPEFKNQLADILTKRINENSNSGRRNMESERNNMASQYNRSGK